jgi:4-amino-4-deoxy-L-arabinose transferase-like glycosyltransferase
VTPRDGRGTRAAHARILFLLFVAAFLVRFLFARADPFLHSWDERFHALVARNLVHDPFTPVLIANPVAAFDFRDWRSCHVWLHKQPLFLWQMALGLKVFGTSELAVRLPSVLLGSLMVPMLFRVAFLLTADTAVSLLAALLLCFSSFHLSLVAGIRGMDHNDVAFGFYVLASLWAFSESRRSPAWGWAALAGAFAGCAVLNKWLVGLTVFLAWGVDLVLSARRRPDAARDARRFLFALAVCAAVAAPWQVYAARRWPEEARYENAYNVRHLTEALEGHEGSAWYYAASAPELVGAWIWVFVPAGIAMAAASRAVDRRLLAPFLAIVGFVFCFFSFAVKTKINSYVFFAVPLCLCFLAYGVVGVQRRLGWRPLLALTFLACTVVSFDPLRTRGYFSGENAERHRRIETTKILKGLKAQLPPGVSVVLNTNDLENVDLMFYANDLTAYARIPEADLAALAAKGVRVAAFKGDARHPLPASLAAYPGLVVLDVGYAFRDVPY